MFLKLRTATNIYNIKDRWDSAWAEEWINVQQITKAFINNEEIFFVSLLGREMAVHPDDVYPLLDAMEVQKRGINKQLFNGNKE